MAWLREAISDGEVDALARAALAACNEDTRYPLWRGSRRSGSGECYNMACWLVHRLGGAVGRQQGHYVWLSPDHAYYIDLTNHHRSGWVYAANTSFTPVETFDTDRTQKFAKRADRIFESLDTLIRLSLDYAGDAYPAEEPQKADDRERFNDSWNDPDNYWHDEPSGPNTPEGLYQFVYVKGQLEVSPNHSHDELASHAGILPDSHTGPFAAGHVVVTNGSATWEVQANVNLHSFLRILKDATKNYGWRWGGMTDAQGQPITESFAPSKSATVLHYVYLHDHLYLGTSSAAHLAALADHDDSDGRAIAGSLRIVGGRAWVDMADLDVLPSLLDWAADNDLKLYAGNDNVIKTIPDLQEKNVYSPAATEDNPVEQTPPDERLPTGLYRCPACEQLFPNWHEYQKHRREQESWGDPDRSHNGDRGFPDGLKDPVYGDGAHFTEMRLEPGITTGSVAVLLARSWKEAARVDGFMRYATAFNYDNDSHNFYVAYHNGDPVGYAAIKPDGGLSMIHTPFEGKGVARALYHKLCTHFDELYTGAAHDKTAAQLKRYGWIQVKGQKWRWSKNEAPTDMLEAPVPFIYDIDKDKIFVGHPGARTSDIPGRFTPGGIVEGHYEPGGKVVIRSITSVPYTIRHLIELWYYTQPQLEVKQVHLTDDAGRDTRLATTTLRELIAMDAATHLASQALLSAGGCVYAVGGVIRDIELGKKPNDIDLMVGALTGERVNEVLGKLPGKLVHVGKDFGIFEFRHKRSRVQVALPRSEHSTGPEHTAFTVNTDPDLSPEDDLYRRDFTINAMACDLRTGQLLDPYHGIADIESRTLRTLGPHSFQEDPLRVLRALSAVSRHGLDPDPETRIQMRESAQAVEHEPMERVQAELDKIMEGEDPAKAIRLAHETGVLAHVLPEVEACFGFDQNNPHHHKELGEHLLSVLAAIAAITTDKDLRLAGLLHDIGKPSSQWLDPQTGSSHYYEHHVRGADGERTGEVLGANHEEVGRDMTLALMRRVRYPKDRIARVAALVEHHMYDGFSTMAGARRFLARVGDHDEDLFLLRWADQGGKSLKHSSGQQAWDVTANRQLVQKVREANEAFSLKDLAIDGSDLIKAGMRPGPEFGRVLTALMAEVIENPGLNEREHLLPLARSHATIGARHEETDHPQDHPQAAEALSEGVRPRESQKLAQGDEEAEVEPDFPTWQEARDIHDQAVQSHGQPYAALPDPGRLDSALGRAANHYYYGGGTHGERVADAAAALAHGIGMAQAFVDGNKKTAYHTTRYFLHNSGYGHLSPIDFDDEELAAHLMGHGEGTHSLEDTQELFRSRLKGP